MLSQLAAVNLSLGGMSSRRQPWGGLALSSLSWVCRTYEFTLFFANSSSPWTCPVNYTFSPSTDRLPSFLAFLGSVTHNVFDSHRLPSCHLHSNHSQLDHSGRKADPGPSRTWCCLFVSQSISYTVFSKLCFVISLMLFKLHGTYFAFAKSFHWINISITYCFTLATELLQFVGKIEQRLNSFFSPSVKCPVLLALLLLNKGLDLFCVLVAPCLYHYWVKIYR